MVFHVSSTISMEYFKFRHWLRYCLCWCSLSFDISIRAEVFTLRNVVTTGHKQPLMGRAGEWALHTNIRIVNLSQSFGYRFFLTQSYNQINTSSDPKEQSRTSTLRHLSGAEKTLLRFTRCFTRSCHRPTLTLNNPKKTGCSSLQIGFDGNLQFLVGKHVQESEWNHHLMSWVSL